MIFTLYVCQSIRDLSEEIYLFDGTFDPLHSFRYQSGQYAFTSGHFKPVRLHPIVAIAPWFDWTGLKSMSEFQVKKKQKRKNSKIQLDESECNRHRYDIASQPLSDCPPRPV